MIYNKIIDGTIDCEINNVIIYIMPKENGIEKLNKYLNKTIKEAENDD